MCVLFVRVCGAQPQLGSALASAESADAQALLHPSQGDVDNGNQAPGGAQRAEQPVCIGPLQNLHDVALVEAQLARFGGYVVAQRSHFAEEKHGKGKESAVRLKVWPQGGSRGMLDV